MEELNRDTILRLPLRGIVALASRAARKAQPLFHDWSRSCGTDEQTRVVEIAIRYAEEFAAGTREPHELCGAGDRLEAGADAAAKAASDANAFEIGNAAETAALAARAAINASDSVQGIGPHTRLSLARATAVVAFDAVQRMLWAFPDRQSRDAALQQIVADFNELIRMNLGAFPEAGHPVGSLPRGRVIGGN